MKQIGLLKAILLVRRYNRLSSEKAKAVREERFSEIVDFARENSPYYKKLYASVSARPALSELPPIKKSELMAHFDEWLTDRQTDLAAVRAFMENEDNIGRLMDNKYLVFTTSGSSGEPCIILCDKTTDSVMSAVNLLRAYARKEDFTAFFKQGARTAGVFATGGFYLAYGSVRARQLKTPWKKKRIMVTSVLQPMLEIVKELNEFQPVMLGGYPTALELLAHEQDQGRLNIKPVLIMAGGEYLSRDLRNSLSSAFGCYVQSIYSCTEGGTIACECRHRHYHVNEDWAIVEPVDSEYRPVPDGVQSDRILLTNLSNFTQPFIRYEITDRVVMHHEPCPCGNPSPWLEVEGRTDDILSFRGENGPVSIVPLALYAALKQIHSIERFQLIAKAENNMELRIMPSPGAGREDVFGRASERLRSFLCEYGIKEINICLSDELPQANPKSGKFKHVYKEY
jgi:phenylacetate-coenzyme A ligase PaaK-like adenylate-forming protein